MTGRKALLLLSFAAMAGSLCACDSIFGIETVEVRPVETAPTLLSAVSDSLYEGGVYAINAKDYGRALLYLQEARNKNPDSAKILNALGVVYDKLGRFDLSARYYGLAHDADPTSAVVVKNMEYSRQLQGLYETENPVLASANEIPADSATTVKDVQLQISTAKSVEAGKANAAFQPEMKREVASTSHALRVLNASGRRNGARVISTRLSKLKWAVRASDADSVQSKSILLYAPGRETAARGIKRTLPFSVIMAADASGNPGITLMVGRDYLKWKPRSARLATLWKNEIVAALPQPQNGSRQ